MAFYQEPSIVNITTGAKSYSGKAFVEKYKYGMVFKRRLMLGLSRGSINVCGLRDMWDEYSKMETCIIVKMFLEEMASIHCDL